MAYVPLQGIGMRGLNRDTPSFAQDHTTFNDGINLRPLNGSLQGVYNFNQAVDSNLDPGLAPGTTFERTSAQSNPAAVDNLYATGVQGVRVALNAAYPSEQTPGSDANRVSVNSSAAFERRWKAGANTSEIIIEARSGDNVSLWASGSTIKFHTETDPYVISVNSNLTTIYVNYDGHYSISVGDHLTFEDNYTAQTVTSVTRLTTQLNGDDFNGNTYLLGVTPGFSAMERQQMSRGKPRIGHDTRHIYAFAQWTDTTNDEVNVAYMYDYGPAADDLQFQVVQDVDGTNNTLQGAMAATELNHTSAYGIDLIPFNGLLIANDGENQPIEINRGGTANAPTYTSRYIQNWLSRGSDELSTSQRAQITGATYPLSSALAISGSVNGVSNISIPSGTGSSDEALNYVDSLVQRSATNRITAQRMRTFNNRLICINISDNYVDGGNATLVWSTPITRLGDLSGVTFVPATTNTAGDDIITETPGNLQDAGQLGNYLIVYKSDAVYAITDTGDPLYLVSQQIFNDDGILAPDCFADIGNSQHFVVGHNGIYIHDGGVNKRNVSKGRVEDYFYSQLRNPDRTFVFHHKRDKEVWVCYYDGNSGTVGVNRALVYNYELDAWHERDLNEDTNNIYGIRGITATNLNGNYMVYLWGNSGVHQLQSTYTSNGHAEFDRHDLGDSTITKRVHGVYPQTSSQVQIALKSTEDLSTPPAFVQADRRDFDPSAQYKVDYRLYGRYFDLELRMMGAINPDLTGINFDITPGGRR